EDTKELKQHLNKLGFGNIKVTTLFGSFMEKRMKDFQDYYGLKAHGIADSRTLEKLDETINSPFQRGKRHEDTKELKQHLNKLGFGNIKVTTLFGSFMEKRMKDFQDYYGLKAHGIADSRTLEKLDETNNIPTRRSTDLEDTKELKQHLNKLGFGNIKVTTLFGRSEEQRIKEDQEYYGLKAHGIADSRTLEKLDETINSPLQRGKRHEDTKEMKQHLNKLGFG